MPAPLTAKRPPTASLFEQVAVLVLVGGPLFGLWYCWKHHRTIHFDNPWLNLGVHVAMFVFPLVWVCLFYRKPVVYEAGEGETILSRSTYFDRWPVAWWNMFMMWATPVVVLVVLAQAFVTRYLPHPESLQTTPTKALVIMSVMTVLGIFYGTVLLGRSEPATWISDEGLRTGILRFHEWKDVHHISQHGDLYAFYHNVNPALPAGAFKVREHEAKAVLEGYLSKHNIRMSNDSDSHYFIVKVAVVSGFIANVAFSLWLRFNQSMSFVSVVLISFGVGIFMTVILEKFRGVSKYGKYRPIIEPPHDDEIGDAPKPIV